MFGGLRDAQVPGLSGLSARQGLAEKQESACLPSILVAALAEGHRPQPPGASVHYTWEAPPQNPVLRNHSLPNQRPFHSGVQPTSYSFRGTVNPHYSAGVYVLAGEALHSPPG